jgi:hypothetical protein
MSIWRSVAGRMRSSVSGLHNRVYMSMVHRCLPSGTTVLVVTKRDTVPYSQLIQRVKERARKTQERKNKRESLPFIKIGNVTWTKDELDSLFWYTFILCMFWIIIRSEPITNTTKRSRNDD